MLSQRASVVATDGTITDGPYPQTKAVIGFSVIDVPSREEALAWAAKIAAGVARGTGNHARPERLTECVNAAADSFRA